METNKVYQGNNIDVLKTFPDNSIDSIVTDPPYGINFMGKKWDYDVPSVDTWKECLRVLKPGGHILVACGTRTQHRMAVNIEDAGFEIRDIVAWVYGSGFPKSMDISKAVESKILNGKSNSRTLRKTEQDGDGKEYTLKGRNNGIMGEEREYDRKTFEPQTDQAKQWQGWGTALKPSAELWTLARKPFNTSVAENVLKYGTGGLNIDECRIGNGREQQQQQGISNTNTQVANRDELHRNIYPIDLGRFPANLIHDGSDEVVKLFPKEAGGGNGLPRVETTGDSTKSKTEGFGIEGGRPIGFETQQYADKGSAARFFKNCNYTEADYQSRLYYCPKASKEERNMGLYGFEEGTTDDGRKKSIDNAFQRGKTKRRNVHPTVKPLDLMRYLCRLITPPNGICLDPYLGSGTTAVAAKLEDFQYIGIEMEEEYCKIAEARIAECDKDYKTKAEALKDDHVAEIYDIFDFMKE